jgi:hypothetical protein
MVLAHNKTGRNSRKDKGLVFAVQSFGAHFQQVQIIRTVTVTMCQAAPALPLICQLNISIFVCGVLLS